MYVYENQACHRYKVKLYENYDITKLLSPGKESFDKKKFIIIIALNDFHFAKHTACNMTERERGLLVVSIDF